MALEAIKSFTTKIPLYKNILYASFASPAEDYFQKRIDPRDLLETNPNTTFCMQVEGGGWSNYGIFDKDFVIVDRSIPPENNHLVVVTYQEEFTLRRLGKINGVLCFLTSDAEGESYPIEPDSPVMIWGVVRLVVRKF
ncbi:LexA family protein [Leptospira kmetyi]|uniref:Peptidase S24 n=1 Tax=Leptospira kmetyi TaxID=408139 RepID=A0ABX4N5V6_9LEPT|nr:S24 family peptidase [Leptospira kmetyi]PJZ28772.1 peptidase S24 [Leptospira kmetyi]